jgi:pimeloyl-ACP methyl ester carboxylesterase
VCLPKGLELFDPDPSETDKRDVTLVANWQSDTGGVVGWSTGGWDALSLAAAHPDLPRLVIVSLPYPEEDPESLDAVTAKTLLLFGSADPATGSKHGQRWLKRLPNARLEMVPGGGHELLVPMWRRILSHLAPRRTK